MKIKQDAKVGDFLVSSNRLLFRITKVSEKLVWIGNATGIRKETGRYLSAPYNTIFHSATTEEMAEIRAQEEIVKAEAAAWEAKKNEPRPVAVQRIASAFGIVDSLGKGEAVDNLTLEQLQTIVGWLYPETKA
jgi:hypothetical protein